MFWQVIIQPDTDLNGGWVAGLIEQLCTEGVYPFVQVLGFEGGADQGLWAQLEKEGAMEAPRLLAELRRVRQVDWATFCLSAGPTSIPLESSQLEVPMIVDETVVRCVDGSFAYVYTKRHLLADMLRSRYRCLSATLVDLKSVEWPE